MRVAKKHRGANVLGPKWATRVSRKGGGEFDKNTLNGHGRGEGDFKYGSVSPFFEEKMTIILAGSHFSFPSWQHENVFSKGELFIKKRSAHRNRNRHSRRRRSLDQYDQIGRFLKVLGNKCILKSSPKRLLTFGLF